MIDFHEELYPLSELPSRLPRRANGKRLHLSAAYRWAKQGLWGVRLETLQIGATAYTSSEAVDRFVRAVTDRRNLSDAAVSDDEIRDQLTQQGF